MNIIFDLDGTIGNTLPLCIDAFRRTIEPRLNRPVSDEEIIEQFGPTEEGTIRALVPEAYDAAMESYVDWYRRLHDGYPDPFEGIRELLDALRDGGVFLGVVTGKGERSTSITLEQYRLKDHFDVIKTGSPLGPVKAERIGEIIAERDDPKETYLYVGDSPGDVDACRVAGIRIAGAAWAETTDIERLKEKHPDYLFESVSGFKSFVIKELEGAG